SRPAAGAARPAGLTGAAGAGETALRRLKDGREFRIPKVCYEPAELEAALRAAGFREARVTTTTRFFLLGQATA
ncbi:MAG: hypothetical protein M3301_03510, partial [Chloroflexota bacterium]|nr:hypothetical protein [Chloroflexota bacterium]